MVLGGDVYPPVDSPVHLPGGGPLHHYLRRDPPQDAGGERGPAQIINKLSSRLLFLFPHHFGSCIALNWDF